MYITNCFLPEGIIVDDGICGCCSPMDYPSWILPFLKDPVKHIITPVGFVSGSSMIIPFQDYNPSYIQFLS
jgi:hypothetical protein